VDEGGLTTGEVQCGSDCIMSHRIGLQHVRLHDDFDTADCEI
jgi:hypothetical protein